MEREGDRGRRRGLVPVERIGGGRGDRWGVVLAGQTGQKEGGPRVRRRERRGEEEREGDRGRRRGRALDGEE